MELQADSNHFMLEPVKAEDMAKEIRQEQRAQAVHEAMGLGFLSPSPNRNRRKQYGRPNAKVSDQKSCLIHNKDEWGRFLLDQNLKSL